MLFVFYCKKNIRQYQKSIQMENKILTRWLFFYFVKSSIFLIKGNDGSKEDKKSACSGRNIWYLHQTLIYDVIYNRNSA